MAIADIVNSLFQFMGDQVMANGAGAHNARYRGKRLGTSVTAEQWAAIQDGTFKDMYVGDYWEIGGVKWRIADFDYWLHSGDTECTKHHIVIVPDTTLYTAKMNNSDTTTGAYTSSVMRTTNLASAKSTINSAFGSSHILNHRELLANAVSSGNASGWAWADSTVDLMSEEMVYGVRAWDNVAHNGYDVGNSKSQLSLFKHDHSRICAVDANNARASWWLRGVYSATGFCYVDSDGVANISSASNSIGVRPAFGICAA